MRILLVTQGSLGDIKPFSVLAAALVARGHRVYAASTDVYEDLFTTVGATFFPIRPIGDRGQQEAHALSRQMRGASPRRQIELVIDHLQLRAADELAQDVRVAAGECDIAICHSTAFVAQRVLEHLRIPWASTFFFPGAVPAPDQPTLDLPHLGSWGNLALAFLVGTYLKPVQRRIEHVLDTLPAVGPGAAVDRAVVHPIRPIGCASPYLNLLAFSRHLGPLPRRWPGPVQITGPWLERRAATRSDDLARFLAEQQPEVAVSFGSMGSEGQRTAALVLEALDRVGMRAVIQRGWARLDHESPPPGVLFVDYVPHDDLFAQVPIVVHHGGAGTTAAACRAGAVSVVIPHAGDQGPWARRLHVLGIAARPIPRNKLTAAALAKALVDARSETKARRAHDIAQKLVTEPGEHGAAEALESLMDHIHQRQPQSKTEMRRPTKPPSADVHDDQWGKSISL